MELLLLLLFLLAIVCLPFLLLLGLYYACLFGVLYVLSWIFDRPDSSSDNPSYNPSRSTQKNYGSTTTVISAIQNNDIKSLRYLLKYGGANPNQCDEDGLPAVMLATMLKRMDALQVLLHAGADSNIKNQTGETLIMLAARKGWVGALQILIEAGADLDVQNEEGQAAIFLAVMEHQVEAVRVLIEAGADINVMTPKGETPLDVAKDPEIIRFLEAAGGF